MSPERRSQVSKNEKDELVIGAKKTNLISGETKSVSVFKLYCTLATPYDILLITLGTIGAFLSGASRPILAYLMGSSLSSLKPGNSDSDIKDATQGMVLKYMIVGVGMLLAQLLNVGCWTMAGKRLIFAIKEEYFRVIMRQEQGYFDQNNAFEFSTKVQSQIKQIEAGMGDKMGHALMSISMFISGLLMGLITSWKLTLVLISCVPLMVLGAYMGTTSLKNGSKIARKSYEKAGGMAEEILYSIKTVSSFANFDFETKRYETLINDAKTAGIINGMKGGAGLGFVTFVIYAMYAMSIWYGATLIYNSSTDGTSHSTLDGGSIFTVLFAMIKASVGLGTAAPNFKAISEACASASDFFELRERKVNFDSSGIEQPVKEYVQGQIVFKDVVFTYPSKPETKILKGVDILFEPGQRTAIVGESGSGKSTIVNLIERLYEPVSGTITLDGTDIKKLDVQYFRSLIGYVQQEPVLFNDTIRSNIIFGRENVDDKAIWEALEKAYASSFVKNLGGLDYIVGIKGNKLSGGQKQRIAIARAILTRPKLLILDEATSALDNQSEKEVQKALNELSRGVTTIIIAHRLSTIIDCEKIVAMRTGEVVEVGNHQDLLAKEGYYASLVKSQVSEENTPEQPQPAEDETADPNLTGNVTSNITASGSASDRSVLKFLQRRVSIVNPVVAVEEKPAPRKETSLAEMMSQTRKRLFSLLGGNICLVVGGSIAAAVNGAIYPTYGILLAMGITALSSQDMKIVKSQSEFLSLMFLLVAVSAGLAQFFQNYIFSKIGEILCERLRNLTFIKYLRFHMAFYDKPSNSPGALLTKLSSDTTQLNGVVLAMVGVSIQSAMSLVIGLALGFVYEWRLSLIASAFMPFIILAGILQSKLRKGLIQADEKLDAEAGSVLSEAVINTKTIYSYNMQKGVLKMYHNILLPSKATIFKQSFISGFMFGISQFANFATYATVLYAGGSWLISPDPSSRITFENMMKAMFVILFAASGISQAQQYAGDFGKARLAVKSLFEVLETETSIDPFEEANLDKIDAGNITGKIEFKNVKFAYPTKPDLPILRDISFTINPGESVAFVGFSGSGKSTVIQLIQRFYDITDGQILVDGIDIKKYNLFSLRKRLGIVSQEPYLFKRDVIENIRYGKLDATDEEVIKAAESSNIKHLLENGRDKDNNMSGGEKQRVAIARLLVKNPKIMLFDEATSALDVDTEREVQKSIEVLMSGRTSISIAHRLRTVEKCDKIFVLESGSIVEQGGHDELIEMKGKYFGLYKSQSN